MSNAIRSFVAGGAMLAGVFHNSPEALAYTSQEAPQQETSSTTETTMPQETTTTSTTDTTIAPETTTTLNECREDNMNLVQQGNTGYWDGFGKDTGKYCATLIIPNSPLRIRHEPKVLGDQLARTGNNTGEMAITSGALIVSGLALVRAKNNRLRKNPKSL